MKVWPRESVRYETQAFWPFATQAFVEQVKGECNMVKATATTLLIDYFYKTIRKCF
jgi:hypothetical protein